MAPPVEAKAKTSAVWLCRFSLAVCFFCACHGLLHGQDALKPADFMHYGNWVLADKSFRPIHAAATGDLHYLKRMPENFEIVFRWTEVGKTNDERLAGRLGFSFDEIYRVDSHTGEYGPMISCDFSEFSLNLHTKDPTLPAKIKPFHHGDMVEDKPNNFLKPPGKENHGRLACFGDTVQVIINDHLVYQFNIQPIISELERPKSPNEPPNDLKVWNDSRKRGLFLSVSLKSSKKAADYGIIDGITIRDFDKPTEKGPSPLVDPRNSRCTDWCKSDRWNFTDDKVFKRVNDFLIAGKFRFAQPGFGIMFPKFDGITNPGGSNNSIVIRPFLPEDRALEIPATKIIPSIFLAHLNDDFQSRMTILQFQDEVMAKKYLDIFNGSSEKMLSDGQIFQGVHEKYVMVIYRENMEAPKTTFLAFCKKAAESMR